MPLPVAPAVMVIHAALLVAVHAQPVAAVTVTRAGAAGRGDARRCRGNRGRTGRAAWVTVNVLPPIVSVPVRAVVSGLAATL